jgi:hypothetical protein
VCDTWEFPWYAAWDLAFQCVAISHVDPAFAKEQLLLMCREWYMLRAQTINRPHVPVAGSRSAAAGGWDSSGESAA